MRTTDTTSRATRSRVGTSGGCAAGAGVDSRTDPTTRLTGHEPDPAWVDAAPFRAHVRHLMSVGRLDEHEVALVLGLPTRAVRHLLEGRAGRVPRRISPCTARRVLLVRTDDVRGLRWSLTPAGAARLALHRLRAAGWSEAGLATAVGAGVHELAGLEGAVRCSRLLAVRLVGLARGLAGTVDDEDLVPVASAA